MCHRPACSWSRSKRRQGQCRVQRTPQSRASALGSPASKVIQALCTTLSSVVLQRSFPCRSALLVFKTLKQALRTSGGRIWYFTKSPSGLCRLPGTSWFWAAGVCVNASSVVWRVGRSRFAPLFQAGQQREAGRAHPCGLCVR